MTVAKLLVIIVGLLAPILVAAVTISFGAARVPRAGSGMARALTLGLALGAIGGGIVCGIVIGLALLLRALR